MCEGYERQQLSQRVQLGNLLQQIPFMAQWVNLDQGSLSQLTNAVQQAIEGEYDRIDKEYRDTLVEVDSEEVKQADAFAKVLKLRRKQKGG